MGLPNYRYYLTGPATSGLFAPIYAELNLFNVQWSESLNEPGDFSGSFHIGGSVVADSYGSSIPYTIEGTQFGTASSYSTTSSTLLSSTPGNTVLFVERNGVIQWGGIIWARTYSSTEQVVTFQGKDLISGLAKQRTPIGTDWGTNPIVLAGGTDINTVLKTAFGNATYDVYGMNLTALNTALGTTIPDVFVVQPQDNRDYLSILQDLSRQGSSSGSQVGFDFGLEYGFDPTNGIYAYFKTYFPRRGLTGVVGNQYLPTLTSPGSIVQYSYSEDGQNIANDLYAFGPGGSDGQYVKRVTDLTGSVNYPTLYTWPRLTDQLNLSQIPNPLMVDSMAAAEVQARKTPVLTMEITWTATSSEQQFVSGAGVDTSPTVDDFQLGDEFRITIDDQFLSGFDTFMRLIKYQVNVGDSGQPETITGSFIQRGTY